MPFPAPVRPSGTGIKMPAANGAAPRTSSSTGSVSITASHALRCFISMPARTNSPAQRCTMPSAKANSSRRMGSAIGSNHSARLPISTEKKRTADHLYNVAEPAAEQRAPNHRGYPAIANHAQRFRHLPFQCQLYQAPMLCPAPSPAHSPRRRASS